MRCVLFISVLLSLAGCADLGRRPWETDVQCMRAQEATPRFLTFEGAASVCARTHDDGTFTQFGSYRYPLNLRGAPDLQAQATAGSEYTWTR